LSIYYYPEIDRGVLGKLITDNLRSICSLALDEIKIILGALETNMMRSVMHGDIIGNIFPYDFVLKHSQGGMFASYHLPFKIIAWFFPGIDLPRGSSSAPENGIPSDETFNGDIHFFSF
jgi:hypothetical protein